MVDRNDVLAGIAWIVLFGAWIGIGIIGCVIGLAMSLDGIRWVAP